MSKDTGVVDWLELCMDFFMGAEITGRHWLSIRHSSQAIPLCSRSSVGLLTGGFVVLLCHGRKLYRVNPLTSYLTILFHRLPCCSDANNVSDHHISSSWNLRDHPPSQQVSQWKHQYSPSWPHSLGSYRLLPKTLHRQEKISIIEHCTLPIHKLWCERCAMTVTGTSIITAKPSFYLCTPS